MTCARAKDVSRAVCVSAGSVSFPFVYPVFLSYPIVGDGGKPQPQIPGCCLRLRPRGTYTVPPCIATGASSLFSSSLRSSRALSTGAPARRTPLARMSERAEKSPLLGVLLRDGPTTVLPYDEASGDGRICRQAHADRCVQSQSMGSFVLHLSHGGGHVFAADCAGPPGPPRPP